MCLRSHVTFSSTFEMYVDLYPGCAIHDMAERRAMKQLVAAVADLCPDKAVCNHTVKAVTNALSAGLLT